MPRCVFRALLFSVWIGCCGGAEGWAAEGIEVWLTHPDGAARFERQAERIPFRSGIPADGRVIQVESSRRFQPMEGFGYTLTGGSAQLLMAMNPSARAALLRELFGTEGAQIGVSYLRLTVGASDLNERVFTYNDLPAGETDPELKRFDLGPDRRDVLPVLREILAIQPDLRLMASPWSAPSWMKTNQDSKGGSLKPEWYAAYARYLVKYVQAMQAEGIRIHALTVQNEPLNPDNNPSMVMYATDQAWFIKRHLGPMLRQAGLSTEILCYDHNADRPDYPLTILNDPEAKAFVAGSAFHLYAGNIAALAQVREAHPDRALHLTEQWIGAPGDLKGDMGWHVRELIVGAVRQGCRTVLEWNLAADPRNRPHTDRGGCDRCLGALTLEGDRIQRNPAYYIIAHAAKFVRPGSVRIDSTEPAGLPNVAFATPDGRQVLIVLNPSGEGARFQIGTVAGSASAVLPPGAVATYVW